MVWGAPGADGKWGKDPVWPNTPTWFDIYKAIGGKESGGAYEAVALIKAGTAANKSYHSLKARLLALPKTRAQPTKCWPTKTSVKIKSSLYPVTVGERAKQLIMQPLTSHWRVRLTSRNTSKSYNLDLKI